MQMVLRLKKLMAPSTCLKYEFLENVICLLRSRSIGSSGVYGSRKLVYFNWGQNFQYLLMSIILISSLIAMLLQYMAAKLGIVSQMDLAQAIRARTSKTLGIVLWI